MKLLGSPSIAFIAILIFSYFMYRYWILLSKKTLRYHYLLFSLRTLSILCLLFLLLNPWMNWKNNEKYPQNISVICDLSQSMLRHFEDSELYFDAIQNKIKTWGKVNNANLSFFRLGSKIGKLENASSGDLITEFTAIPDFISFNQPQQILLITDGKATAGKMINDIEYSQHYPLHTIGVGPLHNVENIEIEHVMLPDLLIKGDSVNLKIRLKSSINHDIKCDFIIVNEFNNQIHHDRILFKKGNHRQDITLYMSTDILNGSNLASIIPDKDKIIINTPPFSFKGNLQDSFDDIILITGALSKNSRMIKEILNSSIDNVNIHHYFRMNLTTWNQKPLQIKYPNLIMIVLDDFPIHKEDSKIFQQIVELSANKHIPTLYIQGPRGNLTSGEIIHNAYPFFTPKSEDVNLLTDISVQSSWLNTSVVDLGKVPPQRRSIKWFYDKKPWIAYEDNSVLIGNKDNIYLTSLPDLAQRNFKNSVNSNSIIFQILQKLFLHAYHISKGVLTFEINGKSFNKGEIVQLTPRSVKGIDLSDYIMHAVNGTDTVQIECIANGWGEDLTCSTPLLIPGEYTFYAHAYLSNGDKVFSKTKSAIIQNINVEMNELIQESQALMEISYKTGGTYAPIDSLDTMLANIDITPVYRENNHQISGLSIQKYWWILIILLSIEWYFRKQLGLL